MNETVRPRVCSALCAENVAGGGFLILTVECGGRPRSARVGKSTAKEAEKQVNLVAYIPRGEKRPKQGEL